MLLFADCCRCIHPPQYPHALPNLATSRFWNRASMSASSEVLELVLASGIPLGVVVDDDETWDGEEAVEVCVWQPRRTRAQRTWF